MEVPESVSGIYTANHSQNSAGEIAVLPGTHLLQQRTRTILGLMPPHDDLGWSTVGSSWRQKRRWNDAFGKDLARLMPDTLSVVQRQAGNQKTRS